MIKTGIFPQTTSLRGTPWSGAPLFSVTLLVLASLLTWHCSDAETLADEEPIEVVIQGAPTWDNGMGQLIALKCGYCHAYPKPDIAPNNIVEDLDLNVYETRVVNGEVVRGADSIGRWIFEGILEGPVVQFSDTSMPRQMPLDYGTPVTTREMTYFEAWSDMGSPKDNTPDPDGDTGRGSTLYFGRGCVDCHDLGGGVAFQGTVIGPAFRKNAVTVAKVKSMWLHKIDDEPLSDEDAAAIRSFILTLLD